MAGKAKAAKDSAMAAMMKEKGIMRPKSNATLGAIEGRMKNAWPVVQTRRGPLGRNPPEVFKK